MLLLHDGMTLFHGSSVEVSKPDLARCAPRKDFGRGFYLTSSVEQARSFARIVARRASREEGLESSPPNGVVSRFEVSAIDSLAVRTYPDADAEWLHCIVAHRQGAPFENVARELEGADVIIGKVANDQTNATILAYLAGIYGPVGSESADSICVSLLLPERLQDQACFRTERALEHLEFSGSEEVCL